MAADPQRAEQQRIEGLLDSAERDRLASDRRAEAIHDFTAKLRQESVWPMVVDYVRWRKQQLVARKANQPEPAPPALAPVSINLDLTTACNYACDHCIDWDILNSKHKHQDEELRASLRQMAKDGLQSVILIGGGEPTLYPKFAEFVQFLKEELHVQVSVVTNGGRGDRLLKAAPYFTKGDWVRLSLDSGSNGVFQRMHNPTPKTLTLDEICAWIPKIKAVNNSFDLGYSFVVTWRGSQRDDVKVIENIHEMLMGAERARNAGFDYISYKPFLERTPEGSEVLDPASVEAELQATLRRIVASIDEARQLERPGFRVMESTNLRLLIDGSWRNYTKQPKTCHMQALRQVLTPLGLYNCPAHRGVPKARIDEATAYSTEAKAETTAAETAAILDRFDASHECRDVTCLYNGTNWWLEELVASEGALAGVETVPDRGDSFL